MAKYKHGINGAFIGKVGSVIGKNWRGVDYMQSLPRKSAKAPSYLQLVQQQRFKLAKGFLDSMTGLIAVTFRNLAGKATAHNVAFQNNIQNVVKGEYPDFSLDYENALLSKGILHPAEQATVQSAGESKLRFEWNKDGSVHHMAGSSNRAILIAYCPETNQTHYHIKGAFRYKGTGLLNASLFSGMEVETWMAFIAEDGSNVSDSCYVGRVRVE